MSVCAQCGHELGVGRFCLNCGHAVDAPPTEVAPVLDDWRTDTAERPAVPTGSHRHVGPRPSRLPWLPWVAAAVILLLFAGAGAWLLLRGGDDEPAATATDPVSTPTSLEASPEEPEPSASAEPSDAPSAEPSGTPSGEPEEVARAATVTVPTTAPPNQDVDGNLVRYEGRNMLDGVPETTWRMPGDGSGETLVLELAGPTTITSVGLVNGYAKTAQDGGTSFDWYAGNRRVLVVEWVFDDGTLVRQELGETRDVQSVEVDAVRTEKVELRLVTVSSPGAGPSARDYTAISELSLLGTPA